MERSNDALVKRKTSLMKKFTSLKNNGYQKLKEKQIEYLSNIGETARVSPIKFVPPEL